MPYGDHITDPLPYPLSNAAPSFYENTGVMYDLAINGQPFFLAASDETPYRRATAKYRKDQYDTTREPGEQSLTGWWLRSQSSFHSGAGIKFFEPAQDEGLRYRYANSRGVDVWTQGQVSLLHDTYVANTTNVTEMIGYGINGYNYVIYSAFDPETGAAGLWRLDENNDVVAFSPPPGDFLPRSMAVNYEFLYWVDQYGRIVRNRAAVPEDEPEILYESNTGFDGKIAFVKNRLIFCNYDGSFYELDPNAEAGSPMPEPFYSAPTAGFLQVTSISEGPAAIYVTASPNSIGGGGLIYKITLNTSNVNSLGFPELNVPTVIAQLPVQEEINDMQTYLGLYAVICTTKGVRVGVMNDNGDISYGPLTFDEAECFKVVFRDRFAYVGTRIFDSSGLIRIDLSTPTSTSNFSFAYASDLVYENTSEYEDSAYGLAFFGVTDKLAFASEFGIIVENESQFVESGWLQTGYIRYNMLDGKIFKYVFPRVDTTKGGLEIASVNTKGSEYTLATFPQGSDPGEVNVAFPSGSQEYMGFKFTLTRGTDPTTSPLFTGYQIKSLPAIPRQRMIQYPVFCYDRESDALNNQIGYEGFAWERLSLLEQVESRGDTVRVQDFRTGESFLGLIEELDFVNQTPTDKRFTGFGGLLLVTIRSVS